MEHHQLPYSLILCKQSLFMVPTCFGAIILPSLGRWHQNFFKTYQ